MFWDHFGGIILFPEKEQIILVEIFLFDKIIYYSLELYINFPPK